MIHFNILRSAQQAAFDAVAVPYFPSYSVDHIESQNIFFQLIYKISNLIHDWIVVPGEALKKRLYHAAESISLFPFSPTLEWALNQIAPKNSIDETRNLLPIPKKIEKWLGPNLLYPLATAEFPTRYTETVDDQGIESLLDGILKKLEQENKNILNPDDSVLFEYTIEPLVDDHEKAFAVPGGNIAIFSAFIKNLEGSLKNPCYQTCDIDFEDGSCVKISFHQIKLEDILANLIGHEATHIASRHGVFIFTIHLVLRVISTFFHNISRKIPPFLKPMPLYWNIRNTEYQADVVGAFLSHRAGYNPLGALYLQNYLQKTDRTPPWLMQSSFEFFFTHPSCAHRLRALCAAIHSFAPETMTSAYYQPVIHPRYAATYHTPAIDAFQNLKPSTPLT